LHSVPHRKLRAPDAAAYLGIGKSTLDKRRMTGDGPAYSKLGGKTVIYDIADLDEYAAARRRHSTSDPGAIRPAPAENTEPVAAPAPRAHRGRPRKS
jgi:predicted DNA-binding transcriptional regulator AlpA